MTQYAIRWTLDQSAARVGIGLRTPGCADIFRCLTEAAISRFEGGGRDLCRFAIALDQIDDLVPLAGSRSIV